MKNICLTASVMAVTLLCGNANAVTMEVKNNTATRGQKYLLDGGFTKSTNTSTSTAKDVYRWLSVPTWCPSSQPQNCTLAAQEAKTITYAVAVGTTFKYTIADVGGFDVNTTFTKTNSTLVSTTSTYAAKPGTGVIASRTLTRKLSSGYWSGAWILTGDRYKCYDPTDCWREDWWDVYTQDTTIKVKTYENAWMSSGVPYNTAYTYYTKTLPGQYVVGS